MVIRINFQLSRNLRILEGDYGIVIGYPEEESTDVFDYIVVSGGIKIYLFKHEIELVTK